MIIPASINKGAVTRGIKTIGLSMFIYSDVKFLFVMYHNVLG